MDQDLIDLGPIQKQSLSQRVYRCNYKMTQQVRQKTEGEHNEKILMIVNDSGLSTLAT